MWPSLFGHEEEMRQTVIDSLRAEAVAKARLADVVIYVGGLNKTLSRIVT